MSCWEILGVKKDLRLNKAGPLLSASCRGTEHWLPTGALFITFLSLDCRDTLLLFRGRSALSLWVFRWLLVHLF